MSAKTRQWTGRIKRAVGSLTGNKKLEREGEADRRAAEADERIAQAKDKVGATIDKVTDAAKDTLGIGEDKPSRR